MFKYVAIVFCFWFTSFFSKQLVAQVAGCRDIAATNYNPLATSNDGSCLYPLTTATVSGRCNLPDSLVETSGLLVHHGKLFSNTDSGTPNTFFQLDTTNGSIHQKITITNTSNIDWEEISADSNFLYLGEFGNNNGNRTDLKIVKLSWNQLTTAYANYDTAQFIYFTYPDQTDFTPHINANRFDCEAMITRGDSIYLFAKDWVYGHTRVYAIPKTPGNYTATFLDSFDVGGLITGATYDSLQNKIMLIGYTKTGLSFLWQLSDFVGAQFFKGNKHKIDLGFVGQTEGIAFLDTHRVMISNEGYSVVHQKLTLLDDRDWHTSTGFQSVKKKMDTSLQVFPNPSSVSFSVVNESNEIGKSSCYYLLYNNKGQKVATSTTGKFDVKSLPAGVYTLCKNNESCQVMIIH
jgi:hypothetical protein